MEWKPMVCGIRILHRVIQHRTVNTHTHTVTHTHHTQIHAGTHPHTDYEHTVNLTAFLVQLSLVQSWGLGNKCSSTTHTRTQSWKCFESLSLRSGLAHSSKDYCLTRSAHPGARIITLPDQRSLRSKDYYVTRLAQSQEQGLLGYQTGALRSKDYYTTTLAQTQEQGWLHYQITSSGARIITLPH